MEYCEKCQRETELVQIDIDGNDRQVLACSVCGATAQAEALRKVRGVYVIFLTDRDGSEAGYEEFDSLADLKKSWPHAVKQSETEYTDWVGDRA